jgi:hypothetical protein
MAITKVQEAVVNSGGNGTATTQTIALTGVKAGDALTLKVAVYSSAGNPTISVADNVGGYWGQGPVVGVSGSGGVAYGLFLCAAMPGTYGTLVNGTGNVTVTITSSLAIASTGVSAWLAEWTGPVGVRSPTPAAGSGSSTAPSLAVTPGAAGDLVIVCAFTNASPTVDPGTPPWTNEVAGTWFTATQAPIAYQVVPSSSAVTATWTAPTGAWNTLGAAFYSAVPNAPVPVTGLLFGEEFTGSGFSGVWANAPFNANNVTSLAGNATVANSQASLALSSSTVGALIDTDPAAAVTGFTFGDGVYIEFGANFPGSGANMYGWPALWTSGDTWPTEGEIDIAEVLYNSPNGTMSSNYHWGPSAGDETVNIGTYEPLNSYVYAAAFHTYGVARYAGTNIVFYDGAPVYAYPTNDGGLPNFLLANIGLSTGQTFHASSLVINYVRVFQMRDNVTPFSVVAPGFPPGSTW